MYAMQILEQSSSIKKIIVDMQKRLSMLRAPNNTDQHRPYFENIKGKISILHNMS